MDLVKKIEELREKRAKAIADARQFVERADTEKRDMSGEENAAFDKAHSDAKDLKRQIDQLEAQLQAERNEGQRQSPPAEHRDNVPDGEARETKEYRASFERFLRDGAGSLSGTEVRAMQADSDIGGGFLITPLQMVNELLKAVDDATVIRQVARKFTLNKAKSLGVPTMTTKADDADWTSELKTGDEASIEFGGRELMPHPLAKIAKISNTLIRNSGMSIEGIVNAELARLFGSAEEKAYMTGDGNKKPLGLFVASDNGIGTARDVNSGTNTSVTFDGFKTAKGTLKQQYRRNAQWLMHRDLVTATSKLKDGNGQYIWQASVVAGDPDRLLNLPILESEYAPNTYTAGLYAAVVGDFSYYWIVDALDMAIQRLVELYALTNQVGFIGRRELDAAPVLAEAFVRVKMAG